MTDLILNTHTHTHTHTHIYIYIYDVTNLIAVQPSIKPMNHELVFFLFNDWSYSKNIDLEDFKLTLPKGIDIYVEALGVN